MTIIDKINTYLTNTTRQKRKLWFIQKEPFWLEIQQEFIKLSLPENMSFQQKMWHVMNDTNEIPICNECNNIAKWQESYRPYGKYGEFCSIKCSSNSIDKMQRSKNTCKLRYGVTNPFQAEHVKQKTRNTIKLKYGVDNISQLESIKQIKSQTMFSNYGRHNNLEIIQELMMEKYGVNNAAYLDTYETLTNRFKKTHEVITPSGKILITQGYEKFAVPILINTYKEENIIYGKKHIPKIQYKFNGNKIYFPDFYVKSHNIIIEVKSQYTFNCDFTKNCAKFYATLNNGFEMIMMIFKADGKLLQYCHWHNKEDLDYYLNSLL